MPLDESFPLEPAVAEAPPVVEMPPADVAPETAPQASEAAASAPEAATPAESAPAAESTTLAPAEDAPVVPAFDEKEYLKRFGDDIETPDQLKERLESYKANQLTDEDKGRLSLLNDPAKLAEYGQLVGKDYDKPTAREVMLDKYRADNPGMSDALLNFRFNQDFATKYPTLAAALENPDDYAADDPQLLLEKEAADYDSNAARTALKEKQQQAAQAFLAEVKASQAPTAEKLTPAQEASAQAAADWFKTQVSDDFALPIPVGKDQVYNHSIGQKAAYAEAFFNAEQQFTNLITNQDGTINRENRALVAAFLADPKAYTAAVYNAGKGSAGPSIPVPELANSSQRQQPQPAAPSASPAPSRPVSSAGTAWQQFNI